MAQGSLSYPDDVLDHRTASGGSGLGAAPNIRLSAQGSFGFSRMRKIEGRRAMAGSASPKKAVLEATTPFPLPCDLPDVSTGG